jgi:hypothetical protein
LRADSLQSLQEHLNVDKETGVPFAPSEIRDVLKFHNKNDPSEFGVAFDSVDEWEDEVIWMHYDEFRPGNTAAAAAAAKRAQRPFMRQAPAAVRAGGGAAGADEHVRGAPGDVATALRDAVARGVLAAPAAGAEGEVERDDDDDGLPPVGEADLEPDEGDELIFSAEPPPPDAESDYKDAADHAGVDTSGGAAAAAADPDEVQVLEPDAALNAGPPAGAGAHRPGQSDVESIPEAADSEGDGSDDLWDPDMLLED